MKANYIKKDIITILFLFLILSAVLAGLVYYDMQTNNVENWANNLYKLVITR